ncbi:MAG: DNRLRE domain-containing protein, partial [Coriobacteriia bacterium]|nr:DNRLRE domain-containing protein [Coriobacteriia bacterium]
MKNNTTISKQYAPPRYTSKFSWQKQALAFALSFLMFFTSVPTHLFSGGFFNDYNQVPISHASATELTPQHASDCTFCAQGDCDEHISRIYSDDDSFQRAPEDFYFAKDSESEFADLELIYISKDSNVYLDPETGEETIEFFSSPVRFEDDDGQFVEIDPSLKVSLYDGFAYESRAGPSTNFFPETIDDNTPFLLTNEDYEIRFSLASKEDASLAEIEDQEFTDIFEETEDRPLAAYYEIDSETSFRVTSSDIGIKSEFVLYSVPTTNTFTYELNLTNMRAELFEDASEVLLFSTNATNAADAYPVAVIPQGLMWDSSEDRAYSNDITYKLVQIEESRYYLTLVVCPDYLNSPDRVLPITVDPTITWQGTFASRDDGRGFTSHWVRSGADAGSVIGNTYSLPVGTGASTGRVHRSFVKGDNLNATIRDRTITSASLQLVQRTSTRGIGVEVRRVNDLASGQTNSYGSMTWNNQPGSTLITTFNTTTARASHSINVTAWAREVANGTRTGRGFNLRAANTSQYAEFYGARDAHG